MKKTTLAVGLAFITAGGLSAAFLAANRSDTRVAAMKLATAEENEGSQIFSIPFNADTQFNNCTVLNGGNDTEKWKFYKYGPYIRVSQYAYEQKASDSYLFIPGVTLRADKEYTISFDGKKDVADAYADAAPTVEFGYAPQADIESVVAVNTADVPGTSFATVNSDRFSVPANGTYNIVLHHNTPIIGTAAGYIEVHAKNVIVTEYDKAPEPVSTAKPLPYMAVPTLEEMADFTVLDANGDEYDRGTFQLGVWNYDMQKEQLVYYYSNSHQDADDYVFLPQLQFNDPAKAYNVALDAMCGSASNPESFELYIGKTTDPAQMRCFYASGNVLNDEEWVTHEVPVGVPEKGDYYVAVKATSAKDQFKLVVKNISVEQTAASADMPQAPGNITATAGERGALTATVDFTIPSQDIAGKPLTGNVTVSVASPNDTKTVTGTPGQTMSVTLATAQGNNAITLSASNSAGTGGTATVDVYTGVDIPRIPVTTSSVSADNRTLHIEWPMSETGLNGGYVDPATVVFTVSRYDADDKTYDDGVELTGIYSYDYTVEPDATLHRESFIITARNIAGHEEGSAQAHGILGKPYLLPMDERIASGKLSYEPLSTDSPDGTYLYSSDFRLYDLATIFEKEDPNYPGIMDGHTKAMWAFVRYGEPGKCRFVLPMFSTEGVDETKVKMNVFINSIFPDADVYAATVGNEPLKLGTITSDCGQGWTDVTFRIPASFGGKQCVTIYFDATFTDIDAQNIFLSSYYIGQQLASDMAVVSLEGPDDALSIGDKGTFTATVRNEGKTEAAAPELTFVLLNGAGEVAASVAGTPDRNILAPEETAEYTYEIEANADNMGEYTLEARIGAADDNPDNNSAAMTVNLIRGLKPVVNDLTAAGDEALHTVTLEWSKPDIKLTGLDDFEEYAPFEYGRYIGLFKNIDLDNKKTYSYDQCVFDAATLPKAFMVINPEYLNNRLVEENYTPHSGSQYLVAFCPADGSKADDWLISPQVKPGTVVSFYVTTVGLNEYAERYEFCYSSTTNDPSEFKPLAQESVSGMKWSGKAYMLPDDAKYFAIHYVSADVFGIMIDDIDYTPVINEKSEFRYNVYADGSLIGQNLPETRFVHSGVDRMDSRYNVTAVVDGIEHEMSNTATPLVSAISSVVAMQRSITPAEGMVAVKGYASMPVYVFTTDGRLVYSAADGAALAIPLPRGIYVVRAGNDTCKVAVR